MNSPTRILVDGFKHASQTGKCFARYTVTVDCRDDIRPGFVDGRVNNPSCWVDAVHVAALTVYDRAI
jgi:hypothetical protein